MRTPRVTLTTMLGPLVVAGALLAASCSSAGDPRASETSTTTDGTAAVPQGAAQQSAAQQSNPDPESQGTFPGEDWQSASAEEAGMDPAALEGIAARAEMGDSNCLVVTRGGRLVGEWYWNGTGPDTAQEIFSASKSFTSVLAGIASDDGDLSVEDRASEWIPQWVGTPSEEVTVEELLSNTSGRYQSFDTDYVQMATLAPDKTAFSVGLEQQFDPGSTWMYNNAAIQTLEEVISGATGTDLAEFAQQRLLDPLGMADTSWARDRAGNPLTFMGVQSTCRDMARFGHMALNEGNWNGEQIVSEDWMRDSTGAPSQDLNSGYGWLWWLNRPGTVMGADDASGDYSSSQGSQMVNAAPQDMFFALGLGGQVIAVDPGTETVVTRLGPPTYPPGIDRFTTEDATRVATEAVTGPMQY